MLRINQRLLLKKGNQFQMSFFNGKISNKFKTACCKYGMEGKCFSPARAEELYSNLKEFLTNWKMDSDRKQLIM